MRHVRLKQSTWQSMRKAYLRMWLEGPWWERHDIKDTGVKKAFGPEAIPPSRMLQSIGIYR